MKDLQTDRPAQQGQTTMDPITTAIIAALAKLAEPAIKDAYDGLAPKVTHLRTNSGTSFSEPRVARTKRRM